jgi:exo-1,4-beta-D-glucosaminidase
VLHLPEPAGLPDHSAYFVDLRLISADGRLLSTNCYWLSTQPDVLADTSTWYMTPVKSYADLSALTGMPQSAITARATFSSRGGRGEARVTLHNPGPSVAFFVRLQVIGRGGEEALPVLWEDNYVSLLPGERRVITASYALRDLGGAAPQLIVSGWNVGRTVAR